MPSSPRNSRLAALVLVLIAAVAVDLSAHRLDEYLQAARLGIDPDRVEVLLDLTPGTAVAERVLAEIDRDGDQSISTAEGNAYVERVVSGIGLEVDGRPLRLALVDSQVPAIDALRQGVGTMRLRAQATLPRLPGGVHQVRYRNAHRSDVGVYLANALVPSSDRVTVTAQRRDVDQRELTIDYTLRSDRATWLGQAIMGAIALAAVCLLGWRRMTAPGPQLPAPGVIYSPRQARARRS